MKVMKRWMIGLVCAGALSLGAGCAEDVLDGDQDACQPGMQLNPVSGLCVPAGPGQDVGGDEQDAGDDDSGTPNEEPDTDAPEDTGNPDGGSDAGEPDGGDVVEPPEDCGPGQLIARACATNGQVLAAANATIRGVNCDGEPFEMSTRTGSDGTFEFADVPAGLHEVEVSSGSFSNTRQVTVYNGQTTDLTADADKLCVDASEVPIAVLQGQYDNVRQILQSLDLEYTLMGQDASVFGSTGVERAKLFLENPAQLNHFRILFIECGTLWMDLQSRGADMQLIAQNLRQFVANGNSIYASDWAHPFINEVFEGMIEFEGTNLAGARVGSAPQTVNASVDSTEMQTLLNGSTASIQFSSGDVQWVVARSVGPNAQVHFSADVTRCSPSCGAAQTGTSVVQDSPLLVTQREQPNYGTVVFTSFHNKEQSNLGEDMQRILEFLIFRL
ncbi:carboxypeptidase regulatory-like domain-containing protein [Lujinxingia vulgaris]|uniref:Carboxypeptidase regulatory-like domain-containing protein n=1 Tax=Lujinxingia vulgaris TaxID=2600176 RepID=A0A5C6X2N3_9DELT|nr:carboxypeptidase-like regulatory domain-containing protein [Lujinxingia vulgaris]TXD36073.1 carboxypeptidase regulatory-like domain-containing protein [Lujinxingia vulgaris]